MKLHKVVSSAVAVFALAATATSAEAWGSMNDRERPFSWTGLYVGLHLGGGGLDADWRDVNGNLGADVSFGDSGVVGGGQLGYNWQAGGWVFGVEGTLSGSGISESKRVGIAQLDTDVRWMATVVGRLGYTWGGLLAYAKGGYAVADVELFGDNGAARFNFSETQSGWTVGGGFEAALTNQISLGVEYNFYDFGTDNFAGFTTVGQPLSIDSSTKVQSVVARINVKLGN